MKARHYFILGIISLVIALLFTGVYRDDEFYELDIFLKYQPTFKLYFYSPTSMSDLTVNDLEPKFQVEEIAFKEFVLDSGVVFPGDNTGVIPLMLIQITLTLLTAGLLKAKRQLKIKFWQFSAHAIINFFTTSFGIAFMLWKDHLIIALLMCIILLGVNVYTLYFLNHQLPLFIHNKRNVSD